MTEQHPIHPVLETWLSQATKGLAERVKPRLTEEIAAHYIEAYEEAIGQGLPPGEACGHALLSLGPPHKARRTFRRAYLTAFEEVSCVPWPVRKAKHRIDTFHIWLLGPVLSIDAGLFHDSWTRGLPALLGWLLIVAFRRPLARQWLRSLPEHTAVLRMLGLDFVACSSLLLVFLGIGSVWLDGGIFTAWVVYALWMFWCANRILRKLKHPYNQRAKG